nr:hypothetical protein CFP56_72709 [Quercus suber]
MQKSVFLSELAKIDEGLSKLKARPITVNESLIAKTPINVHVISEEVKEAARVSQFLEAVNHANSRVATTETQNIPPPRQQGSWKRLNKVDLPSKPVENSSTVESVLSTKRVCEELSDPIGLPNLIGAQEKEKFKEFTATIPAKLATIPRQRTKWKPPDARSFKMNFDGAIFRQENKSGIGVVIRDDTGAVITSLAQTIAPPFQPIDIEAIAAARALEFGEEIGIIEAVLEGDSELIINSLKGGGHSIVSVEPLLHDTMVFSNCYVKLLYSHCRRDGNRLARSLARYFINVSSYVVWMEGVPDPLFTVVQQDVANLAN